jgi:hypothetical protein
MRSARFLPVHLLLLLYILISGTYLERSGYRLFLPGGFVLIDA